MANEYKQTMNLPKTGFPMRAGLSKSEPKRLKDWQDNKVYEQVLKKNEGHKKFVLHDGPPYANGPIHIGHAMNKISKDMINRYWMMQGCEVPYVPVGTATVSRLSIRLRRSSAPKSLTRPPRLRSVSFATSSLLRTSSCRRPASVAWACSATGTTRI